ncbi:MAG: flagellar biosynthetic protein FliQ [Bryobacteraceae bacterium]
MTPEAILRILREGIVLMLLLSAAPVLVSALLGLIVAVFQATTQIQDQSLGFVPKILAVSATLAILGPWMLQQLIRFTTVLLESIALIR